MLAEQNNRLIRFIFVMEYLDEKRRIKKEWNWFGIYAHLKFASQGKVKELIDAF